MDSPPDDGAIQLVKAADVSERDVGANDVIAGLFGGVLDALSIRLDQCRARLVNPAVAPRGGS